MSGADLLARYLRQRQELGESEIIFEGYSIDEWLRGLTIAPAQPESRRTANPETRQAPAQQTAPAPAPPARSAPPPERQIPGPVDGASPERQAPSRVTVAAPAPAAPLRVHTGPLGELKTLAAACTACGLSQSRKNVVFGEGNLNADVIVVGEAPGADEDASGRPFVGAAGKLLDLLLASVGLPRETVYICNVLKCRPPGNRNPSPVEVDACAHLLRGQISTIRPRAILACGTFAAQTLLASTDALGKLRTTPHTYQGVPLIPTYHPAALLRNPSWVRSVWTDLQRLRQILDA